MTVAGEREPGGRIWVIRALERRFATSAARFRLAVTCGFVVAAVGCLVIGHGMRLSDAQSWGGMDLSPYFGGVPQQISRWREPSPQYASHRSERAARHEARSGGSWRDEDRAFAHDEGGPRRSMCVRLCDGFVFPVGTYRDGDLVAHEATCQAECPGAKTELFVVPKGADSITEATEVRTGRSYSELPDAFHYTTYIDGSCSCHPPGGNRIKSLLHDFTLRRGDAVMTQAGIRVFHGGVSFPFKRQDFVALSRSRDVRKSDRANLKAIERASLGGPTTVAAIAPPATDKTTPAPIAARASIKGLPHQARN